MSISSDFKSNLVRQPNPQVVERVKQHNVPIALNSDFPNVILTRYNANNERENFYTLNELKGRNWLVLTMPGAFTPTCTDKHLADYVKNAEVITKLGLNILVIVANNVDVAHAWNLLKGNPASITVWADDQGDLTDALGLAFDYSGNRALGYGLQRSASIVKDGKIMERWIEQSPGAYEVTSVSFVEKWLLENSNLR